MINCIKNCIIYEKSESQEECYTGCTQNYFDKENNDLYRCDLEKCFLCPSNKKYKGLCTICNYNYYPIENDISNIDDYFDCYQEPEGYYLDKNDYLYKKCYHTCELCAKTNHNCIKCSTNYNFEITFIYNNYSNCYENCDFFYYFDDDNNFICTQNYSCPENYDIFIPKKNKCTDNCEKDDIYKFEYNKTCYSEPQTEIFCDKNNPYENTITHKCVEGCDFADYINKICIMKYVSNETNINDNNADNKKKEEEEIIKIQDTLLENIETGFTSDKYDSSNVDSGKDDVIETDKMKITLTSTDNQKNSSNNNNMTSIDLGECEDLLRDYYNITKDEKLYMKKIDVFLEGMKIPKIEYEVYAKLNGTKLEKLNKSICEKTKISLNVPIILTENLDKLNSSSGYYNDICYVSTSDDGTDISLQDRKKEYIQGNKTVCQDGCDFSYYDYNNKKAKCSCKIQESSSSFANITINKDELYKNFVNFKNIANIQLLKCYHTLFSKVGLIRNIGFYIIIIILIFHFFCMIYFYCNNFDKIKNKINDIIFALKNIKFFKKKNIIDNKSNIKNNPIKKRKSEVINKNKYENNNKKNLDNKINKSNKKNIKIIKGDKKRKRKIKINNNFILNVNNLKKNKTEDIDLSMNNSKKIMGNQTICGGLKIEKNKKNIKLIKKLNSIMKLNEDQLNDLPYNSAILIDKRSFCQYYISLMKTKHIFMFSFIHDNDYNSKIVKIDLFFVSFVIYFTVNALFYNDDTMHHLYQNKGSYNIEYKLPQIVYSSLISIILNTPLKLLALSNNDILELKNKKINNNFDVKEKELNKKLSIKFVLYFIISFIFLLLFWYYLSMFCAIYRNTQIHLIEDTLISFGISLIYPFDIYLFPAIFRILALSGKNKKRECLYKFSKILQKF